MEFEQLNGVLKRYRGDKNEVVIPAGIHAIGDWAFYNCDHLHSVRVTAQIRRIGNYAFEGCSALRRICLPEQIEKMGDGVFSGCGQIKELQLPVGVKSLGTPFLKGCRSLEELTVPDTTEQIAKKAFADCAALKKLHIRMRLVNGLPEEIRRRAAMTYLTDRVNTSVGCRTDRMAEHYLSVNAEGLARFAAAEGELEVLAAMQTHQLLPPELCKKLLEEQGREIRSEVAAFLMDRSRRRRYMDAAAAFEYEL